MSEHRTIEQEVVPGISRLSRDIAVRIGRSGEVVVRDDAFDGTVILTPSEALALAQWIREHVT